VRLHSPFTTTKTAPCYKAVTSSTCWLHKFNEKVNLLRYVLHKVDLHIKYRAP